MQVFKFNESKSNTFEQILSRLQFGGMGNNVCFILILFYSGLSIMNAENNYALSAVMT